MQKHREFTSAWLQKVGFAVPLFVIAASMMHFDSQAAAMSARLLVSGYTGTTALENFQALVKLSSANNYGFDYADCEANDGSDLWFTDSSGNVIPHEVDSWTANGDSYIWVKIPEVLPSTDENYPTFITMHWGDSTAKETTSDGVWTGFAGVWHMNASGATTETDASGNGLDAVPSTKSSGGGTLANMATTTGVVGTGRVNVDKTALVAGSYTNKLTSYKTFTASGWFSFTGTIGTTYRALVSGDPNNWYTAVHNNNYAQLNSVRTANESTYAQNISVDNFQNNYVYFTFVFDGTNAKIYSNGVSKKDWTTTGVKNMDDDFAIGNRSKGWTSGTEDYDRSWLGNYDEVRLYDGVQSADRIAADYATMAAPTDFLTGAQVATAKWTGGANDGDITNPGNWTCYDSAGNLLAGCLPMGITAVTVSGNGVKMNVPSGTTLSAASVIVTNCTLGADCDWTGLGALVCTSETVIDLNGYSLAVAGLGGAAMFTNSVDATTATLDVTFSSDATNTSTAIGGNLEFVKRGSGAFTSEKAQTYTGGTTVAAGTLKQKAGTAVSDAYDATLTLFGTGEITVNSNATYVTQNKAAYRNLIVLNGGTLSSTNANSRNITNIVARVTADSAIYQTQNIWFGDGTDDVKCDMGGHTLRVTIGSSSYFQLHCNFTDTYGKFILSGTGSTAATAGYLQTTDTGFDVNATNIDFEVACQINPKANDKLKVRNYKQTGSIATGYGDSGTEGWLEVYGTFIPQTQYFTTCVMQDGSSIDLASEPSSWTGASSLHPNTSAVTAKKVTYANNANVTLLLGTRSIAEEEKVATWNDATRPSNWTTLSFKGRFSAGSEIALVARTDGIYRASGLIIIFR